jgi:hypothetical protein
VTRALGRATLCLSARQREPIDAYGQSSTRPPSCAGKATLSAAAPQQSLGSCAFGILQKLGRALMFPVAVLPAAGLLLGIGGGLLAGVEQGVYTIDLLVLPSAPWYCSAP